MTCEQQMRVKVLSKLYDVKCEQLEKTKQLANPLRHLILMAELEALKAEIMVDDISPDQAV